MLIRRYRLTGYCPTWKVFFLADGTTAEGEFARLWGEIYSRWVLFPPPANGSKIAEFAVLLRKLNKTIHN